jgi:hypothetical protein
MLTLTRRPTSGAVAVLATPAELTAALERVRPLYQQTQQSVATPQPQPPRPTVTERRPGRFKQSHWEMMYEDDIRELLDMLDRLLDAMDLLNEDARSIVTRRTARAAFVTALYERSSSAYRSWCR